MATQQDIDKLKQRPVVDGTVSIGDNPQAAARATQPRSLDVTPPTTAATSVPRGLPAPPNFIADAAGNVQRNTPSASWSTTPGASAAERLASTTPVPTAPNLQTTLGATNPNVIDPVAATRGTVVPPSSAASRLALEPVATAPAAPLGLPAPTPAPLTVGADGVAMTPQAATARASLGATPDVVRAQRAHPGFVDPAAPPPVTPAPTPTPAPVYNRPGTGGPLTDQAGNISADDFARRTAAARAAPGVPPVTTAETLANTATAGAEAANVAAAARPSLAYRAGQAASGAGDVLGRAARLGADPVATAPGRFGTSKTAPGQNGGAASILALTALGGAAASANRTTEDYRERLGMAKQGGVVGDTVARTAGVLSDFGANLLDIPVGALNATGLTDIRPFGSMFNDTSGNYKPAYATDKGGLSIRPDAAQDKQNEGFYAQKALEAQQEFEARAAAARQAGQPAPAAPAAAPAPAGGAAQLLAQPPAVASPGVATANAPALPAAPVAAAAPAAPLTAAQAMESTTPGTAVINGRVVGADEITRLANRNVVSSSAFTNPAVGTLFSEANGGATPTTEQAMALRQRLGQGGAASVLGQQPGGAAAPVVGLRGGIGAPVSARDAEVNQLMSRITDAIGSGRRRTARELVNQLSAYNQASATGADIESGRRGGSASTAAATKAKTPVEQALELAQLQEATGKAEGQRTSNAQAALHAQLQQAVVDATTPAAQKAAANRLAALEGKEPPKRNVGTLKVPIGEGIDARNLELPYDTDSGQFIIPDGLMDLIKPPAKKGATAKN